VILKKTTPAKEINQEDNYIDTYLTGGVGGAIYSFLDIQIYHVSLAEGFFDA
jgi:hypothetical protein